MNRIPPVSSRRFSAFEVRSAGSRGPRRFGLKWLAGVSAIVLAGAGFGGNLRAAEQLQLDSSENLFYVLAAINAVGYDDGIKLPDSNPLRQQLRDYLAKQNIPVLPELKVFFNSKGRHKSPVQDLSQYVSWALSVTGPPEFAWRVRDVEVPPDAKELEGLAPLMIDFHRQANLDQLWRRAQPVYDKEIEKYHDPVIAMTQKVDGYLRVPAAGYLGRRFEIFVDLLGAPQQVQTRNYGDDAFVIVTPSVEPKMYDIRHAYLHFEIDPIMIKYGMDLQQKRSLLDAVQLAPLDDAYKNDFVLLANESMIKAVECRIDKSGKPCLEQAMKQGYVLAEAFYEDLTGFEQQQQGMRFYAEEMINGIDLKHETARLASLRFYSGQLQRKAKQVEIAGPELSAAGKTLEQAEDIYTKKDLDKARDLFLKALEQKGSDAEHAQAWYGLARIAALRRQPDAAVKLFEKTLMASPDGFTKGWTLVYLARLAGAAGEPDKAAKFYQEALAVPGASERTLEAARKESQNILKSQETPK